MNTLKKTKSIPIPTRKIVPSPDSKAESTHVEKGNASITRVRNDRVDPTNTPKAKGRSRNESTMTIDIQHGGDEHPSPKSFTRSEAFHKTPDDGSQHTDQPTKLIDEHEPTTTILRRSGRARRPTMFYQLGLDYVHYTNEGEPSSYEGRTKLLRGSHSRAGRRTMATSHEI